MLEKQILGAALMDKQAAEKVITELTLEHFTSYRSVFNAMLELAKEDKEIDVTSLSGKVHIEYLKDIALSVTTSAYIATHIKQLQEIKHLKDLDKFSNEFQEKIKSGNIKEIHNHLSNIPQMFEYKNMHLNTKDILQNVINDVGLRYKSKDDIRGLRTDFYDLDEMVSGIKPTEIIGLLADPNVGKSLLALNIACNVADRGYRVDYFSYEMSNKQIGYRILPGLTDIRIKALSHPRTYLKQDDIKRIKEFKNLKIFNNLNVYADELAINTVTEIKTKINQTTLKCNKDIDLLVIDYLQLLKGSGEDWENAGENLQLLKGLAKHYQIPIIIIVSKSKDGSIRGSGQIEFDLDQRWELKREHDADNAIDRSATELIVKKNRDGGKGKISLVYDEQYLQFRSVVR